MRFARLLLTVAVSAGIFGCGKEAPRPPGSPDPRGPRSTGLAGDTVARIHWLGKKRLGAETNAAGLMQIWNQPESAKLEEQMLDKLSLASWRGRTNANASALLRTLLEDVVQEECYLEVRRGNNQSGEMALAIRLNDARSKVWEANVPSILQSLTGIRPTSGEGNRGSLKKHDPPNLIEWMRVGEWVVLGAGTETNALFADFVNRTRKGNPYAARGTNLWLEASVDARRTAQALSLTWDIPENFPEIALNVIG